MAAIDSIWAKVRFGVWGCIRRGCCKLLTYGKPEAFHVGVKLELANSLLEMRHELRALDATMFALARGSGARGFPDGALWRSDRIQP